MHLSNNFRPWSDYLRRQCDDVSLTFDAEGRLSLLVDRHKVDGQIAAGSLILSARICNPPTTHAERQAWLCRVLSLTNRHAGERREFPSLSSRRTLQLQVWLHAGIDYAAFSTQFDRFVTALEAWRQAVSPQAGGAIHAPAPIGGKPFSHPHYTNPTGIL